MKHLFVCLGVFACGLFLAGRVEAQHCGTPVRTVVSHGSYATVVKKDVVVEKVITPVINQYALVIPVVTFPTYGAVYQPAPLVPVQPPAQQPPAVQQDQMGQVLNALKTIMTKLDDTDARLRKLEGRESAPPKEKPRDPFNPQAQRAPQDKAASAAKVVARACIVCHDQPVAAEKGGGFAMSDKDGYLVSLSDALNAKVVKRVGNDTMPPKDSRIVLTAEEKEALNAHYGK